MLTTVARFRDPWEAHMLRGRLEAEGIPATLEQEYLVSSYWPLSTAFGGVKVMVPRARVQDAHAIEQECVRGEYKALLRDELGDLDDVQCPQCGSAHFSKRRTLPQILLSVILVTFAVMTPPWTWICTCKNCGTVFRTGKCHGARAVRTGLMLMAMLVVIVTGATLLTYYFDAHIRMANRAIKILAVLAIGVLAVAVSRYLKRRETAGD